MVTGACGLVGRRLVEMLAARGAKRVVAFDIFPRPVDALVHLAVEWVRGDITKYEDVESACQGVNCVFHIAALVGPYFPKEAYKAVNYDGTVNVVRACRALGVPKIVMSSSPSTRFDGTNFRRVVGEDLPIRPPGQFLAPYAETKAMGEVYCREACDGDRLLTVAVSPHQVYGPRDNLFLASFLRSAARLRIFGSGENEISMVYVDNYCHGLMLGETALYPGSPALGKFYVITDGVYVKIWHALDTAVTTLGFPSILAKVRVPACIMTSIAWGVVLVGKMLKLLPSVRDYVNKGRGPFKLNPFAVKMMTIDRSFDISAARKDLKYEPLVPFDMAWDNTIKWYSENRHFWME
jgi:nucleoside-diphosphate-sugar epimerase